MSLQNNIRIVLFRKKYLLSLFQLMPTKEVSMIIYEVV